jgi:ribosome-associated heat shock protein Hsp15
LESTQMSDSIRIDKWLWAARFFKTRTLATTAVELGRILQNEQRVKPAHSVKLGDVLEIHHGEQVWTVEVLRLLEVRGSATVAQTMYQETPESQALRAKAAEDRKYYREPAATITGRPTKRDRRKLEWTGEE